MDTIIEELDFKVLAGGLSYLPGDGSVIYLNQTMSEAEKQETILQLQIAFYALPPVARLFPVKLEVRRKLEPQVVFEDLKGIAGMYLNRPGAHPLLIISTGLSQYEQALVIARALTFWQALTLEQTQEVFKAEL